MRRSAAVASILMLGVTLGWTPDAITAPEDPPVGDPIAAAIEAELDALMSPDVTTMHGARIALSFDTFDPHADKLMQGAHMLQTKLRCMELCEKHGVDVTLIPVMTRGVNEHEIGQILDYAMARSNVRHVEVHTMTFTGQSGVTFQRSGRTTAVSSPKSECVSRTASPNWALSASSARTLMPDPPSSSSSWYEA